MGSESYYTNGTEVKRKSFLVKPHTSMDMERQITTTVSRDTQLNYVPLEVGDDLTSLYKCPVPGCEEQPHRGVVDHATNRIFTSGCCGSRY